MRLEFINGLRGYAILAVIWHHLYGGDYPAGHQGFEWAGLTLSPYTALTNGWLGVNLFFVLSGFVLALPYFDGRRTFSKPGRLRWFYLQRAKRLLPLYYFCVLFSMVFLRKITFVEEPIRDFLLMATATFNFLPETYFPSYNWVLWSLGLEIWFSLAFPFLIIAVSRYGIWRVGSVILIVAMATRFVGYDYEFASASVGNIYLNPIKDSVLGRLDDFYTGVLLSYLCVKADRPSGPKGRGISLFVGGVLLGLATLVAWDNVVLGHLPKSMTPFLHVGTNLSFAAIIYPLYFMAGTFRRVVFENYPIMLAGAMCYSLYVWHGIARGSLIGLDPSFENLSWYALTLFLMSSVSYRYIEFGHVKDWRGLFLLAKRDEHS